MLGELLRAARALARRPVFSLAILATLATTASAQLTALVLFDSLVLRPIPYDDPGALTSLRWVLPTGPDGVRQSRGTFVVMRDENRAFDAIGIARAVDLTVERADGPTRIPGATVSASLYDALRVSPVIGRGLAGSDSDPGAAAVAVLSHAEWMESFGGSPEAVGATLLVDGIPREIVGVQQPRIGFPIEDARVLLPVEINEANPDNSGFFYEAVGRLADGYDIAAANADLDRLKVLVSERFPRAFPAELIVQVRPLAVSAREFVGGPLRPTILAVLGATALLLLVAVANVGSLLTARASGRRQEFALRQALGASRRSIIWAQVAEPIVLVLIGTAAGVGLTGVWLSVVSGVSDTGLGAGVRFPAAPVAMSAFLTATTVAALLSLFTVRPRLGAEGAVRKKGVGGVGTHEWIYSAQVAIAVVLMVGAVALAGSFTRLLQAHPGFAAEDVTAARVAVTPTAYPEWEDVSALHQRILDRAEQIPGVRSVGLANYLPLRDGRVYIGWNTEEEPPLPDEFADQLLTKAVSDGYFETMGIQVMEGRSFVREDWTGEAPPVAIVNQRAAELLWDGRSPIGRRIQRSVNAPLYEVVGVVQSVRDRGLTEEAPPIIYQRLDAATLRPGPNTRTFTLAVLHEPGAGPTTRDFRGVLQDVDPGASLFDVEPMANTVRRSQDRLRVTAALLVAMAGAGLILSAIGLYGGVSYRLGRRAREIGVRIALGASFPRVARQSLASPAVAVLLGIATGSFVASLVAPLLRFVVADAEVGVLGRVAVGASCVLVAVLASMPPLVRASRSSVAGILRSDEA